MSQIVKNLGTGGSALDARLGSASGADSNDPVFLDWDGENYVYLPGVAGNYLSVPDEAALDITGDLDIRVKVAMNDWTPSANTFLVAKYLNTGNQRSYALHLLTSGVLRLFWSTDGAEYPYADSTIPTGITDGTPWWVRVTLDVDNGTSGKDVKFWLSDDGVAWTQLGSTVTTAGTIALFAGTAPLIIGQGSNGDAPLAGKIYRAEVRNGIDGTPVLDVDCSQIASGSNTSFTALTGQTVTINRSTSGRKAVAVTHPCWLFGTDDYMEVADNDLIDFGASDSFTVFAVVRKFATIPVNGRVINKRGPTARYDLYNHINYQSLRAALIDGDSDVVEVIGASSWLNNELTVLGMILNRGDDTLATFSNGSVSSTTSAASIDSLSDSGSLDIGRRGDGSAYADMEFIAAAVFRRALTADEIKLISDYYASRVP